MGCAEKMQHVKILKQLTEIMENKAPLTVANTRISRVDKESTSNDTTAPKVVNSILQILQRKTRANNLTPTIIEKVDDTIDHVEVNDNDNIAVTGG